MTRFTGSRSAEPEGREATGRTGGHAAGAGGFDAPSRRPNAWRTGRVQCPPSPFSLGFIRLRNRATKTPQKDRIERTLKMSRNDSISDWAPTSA